MIVNYSFLPHLNVFLYPSFTKLMELMRLLLHTHTLLNYAQSLFWSSLCVLTFILSPHFTVVFTGHCPLASHSWLDLFLLPSIDPTGEGYGNGQIDDIFHETDEIHSNRRSLLQAGPHSCCLWEQSGQSGATRGRLYSIKRLG